MHIHVYRKIYLYVDSKEKVEGREIILKGEWYVYSAIINLVLMQSTSFHEFDEYENHWQHIIDSL